LFEHTTENQRSTTSQKLYAVYGTSPEGESSLQWEDLILIHSLKAFIFYHRRKGLAMNMNNKAT